MTEEDFLNDLLRRWADCRTKAITIETPELHKLLMIVQRDRDLIARAAQELLDRVRKPVVATSREVALRAALDGLMKRTGETQILVEFQDAMSKAESLVVDQVEAGKYVRITRSIQERSRSGIFN